MVNNNLTLLAEVENNLKQCMASLGSSNYGEITKDEALNLEAAQSQVGYALSIVQGLIESGFNPR